MATCVLDSCCGCIELDTGTKTLGIVMAFVVTMYELFSVFLGIVVPSFQILKLGRLVEVGFLMFMSLILHAFVGRLPVLTETLFAMPVISAVVIFLQFVFLIIFIVRLFKKRIENMSRLYTANAVCFGIECIALAIFLFLLVWDDDTSTEMKIGFVVGDIFATVLNLYFILLFRTCLAREDGKTPPIPAKGKDGEDIITIPFLRL